MGGNELSNCKNCGAVLPVITNHTVKCSYCSTVYNQKQPEYDISDTIENVFSTAVENAVFDTIKTEFGGTTQTGYGTIKVQVKQIHFDNEEEEKAYLQKQGYINTENNDTQKTPSPKRPVKAYDQNSPAVRFLGIVIALFALAVFAYLLRKLL
ncbi:hypothetical protein [Mucilaginibacter celer]|uniref:Uncharacterized protein n=1 Tax=Mucilaginibacter celer TaxID=2305508 RepID=A0A494VWB7_9SPHI|nr:hypothetical protein [Mucilaginibacter celer]AYL95608.1 hypothetical protein HYN43_010035 [Mucilaginibacter celer]